jgi:acetyl esterase/lipase
MNRIYCLRNNRALLLFLVLSAAAPRVFAQNTMDILKLPVPPADQTPHYGADPLQFGELRLPKSKTPAPVIVIVHGGCWADHMAGLDPRSTSHDLMTPLAAALTAAGAATWNIEYRRAGSPNGSWANTYLDLAAATDYLRKLAPANNLDLSRVTVVGHSSGGQLALWIAARAKLTPNSEIYTKNPLPIQQVVDFDGPPDLASAQPEETHYCPIPAITQFTEGTPTTRAVRFHDGSAQPLLPLGIPQTIVTAGLLNNLPVLVESYKAAAESKHDSVKIVSIKGATHFNPLDPDGPYGKQLVAAILAAAGIPK